MPAGVTGPIMLIICLILPEAAPGGRGFARSEEPGAAGGEETQSERICPRLTISSSSSSEQVASTSSISARTRAFSSASELEKR